MANSNDIYGTSVYNEIDSRFTKGQVPAVVAYIDSLKFPLKMGFDGDSSLQSNSASDAESKRYSDQAMAFDYGDGRISKGMRSLELLSKLCKGINPNDLFLFNNIIYSSSPQAIKNATDSELINIVITNLGMFDVVNLASTVSDNKVNEYKQLCLMIGYYVRSGVYNRDMFKANLLLKSREIVKISMRAKFKGN